MQKRSGPPASRVDFVDNLIGPGLDYGCLFGEGKSGADALVKYAKDWPFVGNGCWDSGKDPGVDIAELQRRLAGVVVNP